MNQFVYLIAVENGEISVLNTPSGYELPGGACAETEPHEIFLMRTCLSNTGYDVCVADFVCEFHENAGKEYYYSGNLLDAVPGQEHSLTQIPLTQLNRLTSSSQRKAVEECLNMMRADAHGSDDEDL